MTLPTVLTILRMLLSVVFFVLVLIPESWARIIALVVFIMSAITDKVDGYLARKNHEVTDLGAFLDPLADKILVNLAFLALVYLTIVPIWVFAIILVRDFAVDGLRMNLAKQGKTLSASFFGKLKTTTQIIALIILLLNLILNLEPIAIIGNITLCLALAFTILSALNYFVKAK